MMAQTSGAGKAPSQTIIDSKHLVPGEKVIGQSRPTAVVVLLKPVIMISRMCNEEQGNSCA